MPDWVMNASQVSQLDESQLDEMITDLENELRRVHDESDCPAVEEALERKIRELRQRRRAWTR